MIKPVVRFHQFLKRHDGHGYKLIAGTCIGFLIGLIMIVISGQSLGVSVLWPFVIVLIIFLLIQIFVYQVLTENEKLKMEVERAKAEARHYEHYKNELLAEHQELYKDWKHLKDKERSS